MAITILSPADGSTVVLAAGGSLTFQCNYDGVDPDIVQLFITGLPSPWSGAFFPHGTARVVMNPTTDIYPAAGVSRTVQWRMYLGATLGYSPWATFNAISNSPPACSLVSPIGGASVGSLAPSLTLNFTDADLDVGGQFSAYQLQVRRVSDQLTMWDPGPVAATSGQKAARNASVTYAGTALVNTTAYEWRARVQDGGGLWSAYTAWESFTPNTLPGVPTGILPAGLQNTLTPTIKGTYQVGGSTGSEAAFQYQIQQEALTIYSSADVAVALATGQVYGGSPALAWGTAYSVRVRSKDSAGGYSDWSAWVNFNTNAAPLAPSNVSPGGGAIIGTSTPLISWTHSDPDGDAQTAADIDLYDVTAGASVSGYGPKTLTQAGGTHTITTALTLNHQYQLRVRTKGTAGPGYGPYSAATTFTYSTVPVVALTSPVAAAVLGTPSLTVTWTFSGGSGTQQDYRVVILNTGDGSTAYDSGVVASATLTMAVGAAAFRNGQSYTVQATIRDTLSQTAVTSAVPFSTSFTPPAAVTGLSAVAIGGQQ